MPNENEQQTAKKRVYGFFANVIENTFNRAWNKLADWSGGKIPKFTLAARTGAERLPPVKKEFGTVFQKKEDMIGKLIEIEDKWLFIENKVFPYPGGDITKDPEYIVGPPDHPEQDIFSNAISDKYREIEYFRDLGLVEYEAKMFQTGEGQTIRSKPERLILDFNKIRMNIEAHVANLRAMVSRSAQQQKDLDTCEFLLLNNADELRKLLNQISILHRLEIHRVKLPFINGDIEEVAAFGVPNIGDFKSMYATYGPPLQNQYAASSGVTVPVRDAFNLLMNAVSESLDKIRKIEEEHAIKLDKRIIESLKVIDDFARVKIEEFRPDIDKIRFLHTYQVIKRFRYFKNRRGEYEVELFKDVVNSGRVNFEIGPDEVEPGLDENGWPLEVDPATGEVLLDRWWDELRRNPWHKETILNKPGGEEIWDAKVVNGVMRHGIRRVPEEWIGNIDWLDKVMFIYNEWDSFRDDFRDGRFHPHSKTSMDYIIAGTNPSFIYTRRVETAPGRFEEVPIIPNTGGITPTKGINFGILTTDPKVRRRFKPIYHTRSRTNADKERKGTLNTRRGRGGMGWITTTNIPEDERQVSRRYEMEIQDPANPNQTKVLKNKVRKPTPFDPAFDRAALDHIFIHWGRMYYYETTEGITKWSENPFPHVTTRGISKYLIDLVIRRTFSFNEAREILRSDNQKWDYGVRHYGEPFITDPLGYAKPGEGPIAGAK